MFPFRCGRKDISHKRLRAGHNGPVRHLRYDDIREIADGVLASHNSSARVQVPIDHILEFGYGVTIIPLPGIQVVHEVDAFLSRDRGTV